MAIDRTFPLTPWSYGSVGSFLPGTGRQDRSCLQWEVGTTTNNSQNFRLTVFFLAMKYIRIGMFMPYYIYIVIYIYIYMGEKLTYPMLIDLLVKTAISCGKKRMAGKSRFNILQPQVVEVH